MRYDGAGAHDAVSADSHARHDHGVHPDMRVVADGDTAEPIDICQLRIHMPQRPDTAVMGRDLNAARDPDVVADCHQVRLGAEVKSVKNLTPPPPIVSPRFFRRFSFVPEGMRRQMILPSIDINTSRLRNFVSLAHQANQLL